MPPTVATATAKPPVGEPVVSDLDVKFAETGVHQFGDRGTGLVSVIALSGDDQFTAAFRREHQQFEHALGVDLLTVFDDTDVSLETAGSGCDLRRRTGVQAHLVFDPHF